MAIVRSSLRSKLSDIHVRASTEPVRLALCLCPNQLDRGFVYSSGGGPCQHAYCALLLWSHTVTHRFGRCALIEAVRGAHDAVVEKLVALPGVDLEPRVTFTAGSANVGPGSPGATPLVLAAEMFENAPGHFAYIIQLLAEAGARMRATDESGRSALVSAATLRMLALNMKQAMHCV